MLKASREWWAAHPKLADRAAFVWLHTMAALAVVALGFGIYVFVTRLPPVMSVGFTMFVLTGVAIARVDSTTQRSKNREDVR